MAAASNFAAESLPTGPEPPSCSSQPSDARIEAADAFLERSRVPREVRALLRARLETLDATWFEYPWNGLEEAVAKTLEKKLLLIGYGSLLNRDSASVAKPDPSISWRQFAWDAQNPFFYNDALEELNEMRVVRVSRSQIRIFPS